MVIAIDHSAATAYVRIHEAWRDNAATQLGLWILGQVVLQSGTNEGRGRVSEASRQRLEFVGLLRADQDRTAGRRRRAPVDAVRCAVGAGPLQAVARTEYGRPLMRRRDVIAWAGHTRPGRSERRAWERTLEALRTFGSASAVEMGAFLEGGKPFGVVGIDQRASGRHAVAIPHQTRLHNQQTPRQR